MQKTARRKQSRKIIISILLIIIVMGITGTVLYALFFSDNKTNTQLDVAIQNQSEALPTSSSDLVIGVPTAPITMVEYADYKCPECNNYHQNAGNEIRKKYVDTGKVKIVFRPFPIFSEDGGKALGGSYCANEQGKFPEYHDALFAYMWDTYYSKGEKEKAIENVLTDKVMQSITSEIGMDYSAYATCLENPATRAAYDADVAKAADDEVQGAPSFIIGGRKVVQNQPFAVFEAVIESQLR